MKIWNDELTREENKAIDAFLQDILAVCQRHQLAIIPVDAYGVEILPYDETYRAWFTE